MTTGVSSNDFAQILADFTKTISYKVVTKSVDGMGNETSTFAAASDVSAVFFKEDKRYLFDREGLTEVGDAYILVPISTTINRYDQFTIEGETYYIQSVIKRYVTNVAMLNWGICFKVQ